MAPRSGSAGGCRGQGGGLECVVAGVPGRFVAWRVVVCMGRAWWCDGRGDARARCCVWAGRARWAGGRVARGWGLACVVVRCVGAVCLARCVGGVVHPGPGAARCRGGFNFGDGVHACCALWGTRADTFWPGVGGGTGGVRVFDLGLRLTCGYRVVGVDVRPSWALANCQHLVKNPFFFRIFRTCSRRIFTSSDATSVSGKIP